MSALANEVDEQYLIESQYLRKFLWGHRHIDLLLQHFSRETVDEQELINLLKNNGFRDEKTCQGIYDKFHRDTPEFYAVLSGTYLKCLYNPEEEKISNLENIKQFIEINKGKFGIWDSIDARLIRELAIYDELPLDYQIKFLKDEQDVSLAGIERLAACIRELTKPNLLDKDKPVEVLLAFSDERIYTQEILDCLNGHYKGIVLVHICQLTHYSPRWIQALAENISGMNEWYIEQVFSKADDYQLKGLPEIFKHLPAKEQVLVYEASEMISWNELSNQVKVLDLYYHVQQCTPLKDEVILSQNLKVINIMRDMLLNESDYLELDKRVLFNEFDRELNDVIVVNYKRFGKIDIWPILPLCRLGSKVKYCEGKPYKGNELLAWCPRTRKVCIGNGYYNARIKPEYNKPWYEWSILEFFAKCNIIPSLPKLKTPKEYVNKVCGWVNRLEELRERSKCSVCQEYMQSDFGYAKRFDAGYRATIFDCKHIEVSHDHQVYMNHCWKCRTLIDSRESIIQKDHMYLCINCGSGPKSGNYEVGDICPKCGSWHMQELDKGFKCHSCEHYIIKTPSWAD